MLRMKITGQKRFLFGLGFNDVWLAQGVSNTNVFLKDQYIQEWNGNLTQHEFVFSKYLLMFNVPIYRNSMATFKARKYRLPVGTG